MKFEQGKHYAYTGCTPPGIFYVREIGSDFVYGSWVGRYNFDEDCCIIHVSKDAAEMCRLATQKEIKYLNLCRALESFVPLNEE